MSELEGGASAAAVSSAGHLVRQAREAAGVHVAALAVALKVPVSKLEALEADRLDAFPDAVFARALASSVCRNLHVDPAPVLALLPQTQAPSLAADDGGINAPFKAPHQRRGRPLSELRFSPTLLAVPVLCLGALLIYLWPHLAAYVAVKAPEATAQSAAAPAQAEALEPPAAPETAAPAVTEENRPAKSAVEVIPAAAPSVAAAASAPAVAAEAVKPAPAAATSPVAVAPAPAVAAPPAAEAILSFSATTGTSWIKVTDAKGTVTFQKTLAAGETATATGTPPLAVVVGRADATQVQVRGNPFDLTAVSRDNVARFEVK